MWVSLAGTLWAASGVCTSIDAPFPVMRYLVAGLNGYLGVNERRPSALAHSPVTGGRAAMFSAVPSATTTLSPSAEVRPTTTILPLATSAVGAAQANDAVKSATK